MGEKLGAVEADAAEGAGGLRGFGIGNLAAGLQAEVALRVVRGVGHEPEVGEGVRAHLGGTFDGGAAVEIGEDVAVDHQEGFAAQERQGGGDAACGFQPAGCFGRISDRHAVTAAVAEALFDFFAKPGVVDNDFPDACGGQAAQMPADERLAAAGEHGFGQGVGERAHPLAASGGQYHGFHGFR